ncbi:AAA family ATPase [Kitasatospora aureofaciens]|uniref:AAA family ATPase n=2 Tax=Kitasatospora aureofaciens TaxID=1894 RepID=UPI000B334F11|nr:LuxR family transcriptional regulator [Kitasatospora aureofaciens]
MPTGVLLHRETELAELARAVAGAGAGRSAVVLVRGPRGIGKSALLRAALARMPGEAVVLRARCHDNERDFPYGVVRQLFDPFMRMTRTSAAASQFLGESPGEFLAEALPAALPGVDPGALPAGSESTGNGRERVLNNLFHAARSLTSRTPVVMAVDDLHLADEESRQWFSYLARRLDGLPVALLASTADEAADPLAAELAALRHARTLTPGPLCDSCVAERVAEEFDAPVDPELAAVCHNLSRGNPLVVEELTARLAAARISPGSPDLDKVLRIGAGTLADTTLSWLRQSHPRAAELLTGLAVLGADADLATAALLTGQGELLADEAREALHRTDLIEPGPPETFRHELVRTAVLARTDPRVLVALHERAAALLARLGAPAARTAEHLMSSGTTGLDWAVPVLRTAAREAAADGHWDDAARYLQRALADAADPELVRSLTGQLGTVELHRDVAAAARCAAGLAANAPDPAERARLLRPFAGPVLALSAAGAAAVPFAEAAAALAATAAPPAELLLPLAAQAVLTGRRTALRPALAALRAHPAEPAATGMLGALAALAAAGGQPRTAVRLAARCVRRVSPAEAGTDVLGAAMAYAWTGRLDEAAAWAGRAVRSAQRWNHRGELALALLARCDIAHRQGRLDAALADAEQAAELARQIRAEDLAGAARALAVRARLRRGLPVDAARADAARAEAELAAVELPAEAHPLLRAVLLEARGLLAAHRGDHQQALRLFLECGHQLAARGVANPACVPWRTHAAQAYQALGEHAAARTIAADPLPGGDARPRPAEERSGPAIGTRDAGPVRLTPSERRVTELVLQGLSNLEVAERLCLSKRTVDTHLGRIYRKLAIKGRPELGAAVKAL